MNESQQTWQEIIAQIADGHDVDWSLVEGQENSPLYAKLIALQKIQATYHEGDDVPDQQNETQALFEWGHLSVESLLGEGSYGEVYLAYDSVLNRKVALKLLKNERTSFINSHLFIEEAQHIARVRNRHVLAIHGAAIHNQRVGFWADYLSGTDLSQIKHFDLTRLIDIGLALADALAAVHESGLVHGDVKPANVMQEASGKITLMDFGAGSDQDNKEPGNRSIGSPMLMAPELFQKQHKSQATDMYALGCLLFKLATGQYPIKAKTFDEVVAAHQSKNYQSLPALRQDLPKSLQSLIYQLIEPDPDKRPTALAAKNAFLAIRNEPVTKKKKQLIQTVFISLLLGVLLATIGFFHANKARKSAEIESQKAQAVSQFLTKILGSSFNLGKGREVRVVDLLDQAVIKKNQDFKENPETLAILSEAIGNSYYQLEINDKALTELLLATNYYHQHPEKYLKKSLLIQSRIAMIYHRTGELDKSLELLSQLRQDTESHEHLANIHQLIEIDMGDVLTDMRHFKEAEAILVPLTESLVDPQTSLNNYPHLALKALSELYLTQSKFDLALEVNQKTMQWLSQYPHRKASNLLAVHVQKGVILSRLGRLDEAEVEHRHALKTAEELFGLKSKRGLSAMLNLSANLQEQGKLEEALKYQLQIHEISRDFKGLNDTILVSLDVNLANTYVSLNRIDEGEQLMLETLKLATEKLGESNLNTLTLVYNLTELYNNNTRFSEAAKMLSSYLPIMHSALGENHLITLLSIDNNLISQIGLRQCQQALQHYPLLIDKLVTAFGQSSPYTQLVSEHHQDGLATCDYKP